MTEKNISKLDSGRPGFLEKYVKIIVVLAVIAGSSSGIFGRAIEAPSMAIGFWRLTLGLPFFAYKRAKRTCFCIKEEPAKYLPCRSLSVWTFLLLVQCS